MELTIGERPEGGISGRMVGVDGVDRKRRRRQDPSRPTHHPWEKAITSPRYSPDIKTY